MRISTLMLVFLLPISLFGQGKNEMITCGDNQIILFDIDQSKDTVPHVIWRWKASEAFDLPREYRTEYFRTIDECKPIEGGKKFLITSSSGGVGLIDRKSKKTIFYAQVGNAHSAEILPNQRVIVAASTHKHGNRIELFDLKQAEKPLFQDSLHSGHGVIWDDTLKLLFALGYDELRAYQLENWATDRPSLKRIKSWKIPGTSGHDLVAVPHNPNQLILTEHESVWIFEKDKEQFLPFPPLMDQDDIKSLSIHPDSKRLAYIQAEISWWSHRIYLQQPKKWFSFPGVDLYKARWVY